MTTKPTPRSTLREALMLLGMIPAGSECPRRTVASVAKLISSAAAARRVILPASVRSQSRWELVSSAAKPGQLSSALACTLDWLLTSHSHNKADCPNAEVFTGTCNICNKPNHKASECPDRGPVLCKNCNQEGSRLLVLSSRPYLLTSSLNRTQDN